MMKGLLLKDFYVTIRSYKIILITDVLFIAASIFFNDITDFIMLVVACSTANIPINLLSDDEKSRWDRYSGALPYTKAQIVSSKYLIGLFSQLTMYVIIVSVNLIKGLITHEMQFEKYAVLAVLFFVGMLISAVDLPVSFRLGVEKGRTYGIILRLIIVLPFTVLYIATWDNEIISHFIEKLGNFGIIAAVVLVGAGIYALSWALSIALYKKREN